MVTDKQTISPIQPIANDRFVPNRIVVALLESSTLDMNKLAMMDFTQQERIQFAQLIGYSLNGFAELSYVDDETYEAAVKTGEGISEIESRNAALREKLMKIQEGLRIAASEAFEIHPDDLGDT